MTYPNHHDYMFRHQPQKRKKMSNSQSLGRKPVDKKARRGFKLRKLASATNQNRARKEADEDRMRSQAAP